MRFKKLIDKKMAALSLRAVNRLKHERKHRARAAAKKAPLIRAMYGDDELRKAREELDQERQRLKADQEAAQLELEFQRFKSPSGRFLNPPNQL